MSGCERGMIWAEALTQADDCTLQANNSKLIIHNSKIYPTFAPATTS